MPGVSQNGAEIYKVDIFDIYGNNGVAQNGAEIDKVDIFNMNWIQYCHLC